MAHRRGGSNRGGKIRRQTQWDALNGWSSTTFNIAGEGFVLAFSEFNQVVTVGPVPPPTPLTIIRSLLSWRVLSPAPVAGDVFYGGIGMCVVTQEALDEAILGGKSIPLPVSDASSDVWFLHEFIAGQLPDPISNGGQSAFNGGLIESRAMRKIDDGYQVVIVGERDPEDTPPAGSVFDLDIELRVLVKVA